MFVSSFGAKTDLTRFAFRFAFDPFRVRIDSGLCPWRLLLNAENLLVIRDSTLAGKYAEHSEVPP
jgi:hypothetical protein